MRATPVTIESLRSLVNLTEELQLPQTLEEMLQRVVDQAAALFGTADASIHLLDATRTELFVGARAMTAQHRHPSFDLKHGAGLVGWVAEKGRPLRVDDCEADPRCLPRRDLKAPFGSFLGVPLVFEGSCFGVLSLIHPDK